MKRYTKIGSILLWFILFTLVAYATVTTASSRKSAILPWQWTPNTFYDSAHNVWTSYLADTRFTFDSWSSAWWTSVVKDNTTLLYWQSNGYASQNGGSADSMSMANSITYCNNLIQWWYTDWRLPSIKELLSIVDLTTHNPSINTSYFTVNSNNYRSSSAYAPLPSLFAYYVFFNSGVPNYGFNSTSYYVRCVR